MGRRVEATWAPLVVVGGSVVLIVAHLWLGDRFARVSAWVAHHVEKGLATLLLAPLWMITTLLPWCLHRVLVVDPLAAPLSPAGTIAVRRTTGRPHLLWEGRHWTDRLPWFARVRQRLAMPLGALLVVAVAISAPSVPTPAQPADAAPVPAAVADAKWWPEHVKIANWYLGNGVDPVRYRRQRDIASPTINVENGERSTWSPPPCRCPRLEVWMYGGSTTFGLGQRDDHTIPSELARRARADGIDLHVVNRGVIGDTHWAESLRFTWDSEVESKPDLVVFLDGYNELLSSRTLNETGRADGPDPADPTLDAVQRRTDPLADPDHGSPATPDGIELGGLPQGATLGPVPLGRAAAGRYLRSLSVSAFQAAASSAVSTTQALVICNLGMHHVYRFPGVVETVLKNNEARMAGTTEAIAQTFHAMSPSVRRTPTAAATTITGTTGSINHPIMFDTSDTTTPVPATTHRGYTGSSVAAPPICSVGPGEPTNLR